MPGERRQHYDEQGETVRYTTAPHDEAADPQRFQHDEHGGFMFGAAFFGWLVAVGLTILLAAILSAGATAVGASLDISRSEAEREAGTLGLATAIALLIVLMVAYFAGGYVAGRMARFDGGRQGLGVWGLGLLVTIVVAIIGAIFGSQYDVLQRANLPSVPLPADVLTAGGIIAIVAVLAGTFLAAILGGKAGQRYHTRIDHSVRSTFADH